MVGIDNSPAMLADAAPHARPGRAFERGDIGAWTSRPATTTWCSPTPACSGCPTTRRCCPVGGGAGARRAARGAGADERRPCRRTGRRRGGGHRAVRCRRSAGAPPADPVAANVLRPEEYADAAVRPRLRRPARAPAGVRARAADARRDVVEWVRGTTLTRFARRLPAELYEPFVDDVPRDACSPRSATHEPYFFPFKRILMWGRRPALHATSASDRMRSRVHATRRRSARFERCTRCGSRGSRKARRRSPRSARRARRRRPMQLDLDSSPRTRQVHVPRGAGLWQLTPAAARSRRAARATSAPRRSTVRAFLALTRRLQRRCAATGSCATAIRTTTATQPRRERRRRLVSSTRRRAGRRGLGAALARLSPYEPRWKTCQRVRRR